MPKYTQAVTKLIKVEAKNPKKDPVAARKAFLVLLCLLNKISPKKAPKNGPMRKPKGIGAKIPTIRPMVVPIAAALLPPNRLVPAAGIT